MTAADLLGAIEEEGPRAAIDVYRKQWKERGTPPVAENALNTAGYLLLFSGRQKEGLELLQMNVEAYPSSSNAYDSLGDAYLAIGEREKALEATKKAAALLGTETGLTPERRAAIQGSIDGKLKQLE